MDGDVLFPDISGAAYLASGQRLSTFCRHLVDHLFPELGGKFVAFGAFPLDDG